MSNSRRRDVLKTVGAVVTVGGTAGCAGQDDTGTTSGQEGNETEPESGNETDAANETDTQESQDGELGSFRVAHLSPDAPNVDIYVDGEVAIEDLGFREVSPYASFEPGPSQIQVTAADDSDTVVFDEEIEFESGVANTAIAFGEAAGGPETAFSVEILEDDFTDPGEGTSRVRLFHASPDAGNVDVVVVQPPEGSDGETLQQGDVLFEGVGFGDSKTQELPAGEYSVGVVPTSREQSQDDPIAEFDLSAESQTVYSVFAVGYVDPEAVDSNEAFGVVTVEDAAAGELPAGGTKDTAGETENETGNETETGASEQLSVS